MNDSDKKKESTPLPESSLVEAIFDDAEAKRAFVGFFDLALKVHMRIHPELYRRSPSIKSHD